MIYLIKIIFFLLISHYSLANENKTNQILFKINNKVYTNIDFEERKKYVSFVNNFIQSEFSELEKKEILEDYISALIFYEYYNEKKIFYKKLNNKIELKFKKNFKDSEILNHNRIKNLKFNINIDLGYFDHIVPCGIKGKGVTSLSKELGKEIDVELVKQKLKIHLGSLFDAQFD